MSGAHQRGNRAAFFDSNNQRHRFSAVEMTTAAPPPPPRGPIFLGVDVGTGSARAGLFDNDGRLLSCSSSPIQIWKDGDCVEVKLSGSISSQYLTALLMAAPLALGDVEIEIIDKLISVPYVEMTLKLMEHFGVFVEHSDNWDRFL